MVKVLALEDMVSTADEMAEQLIELGLTQEAATMVGVRERLSLELAREWEAIRRRLHEFCHLMGEGVSANEAYEKAGIGQ